MNRDGERGSASMLTLTMIGVLVTVAAAVSVAAAMVHAHRVAQSAADLGALAGAAVLGRGGDGCAAAGDLVSRNGAELVACQVTGTEVLVEVSAPGPSWRGHGWELGARARAGTANR